MILGVSESSSTGFLFGDLITSYHNRETLSFTIDPHDGNSSKIP